MITLNRPPFVIFAALLIFFTGNSFVTAQVSDADYEKANTGYNETMSKINQTRLKMQEANESGDLDTWNQLNGEYESLTQEVAKYSTIKKQYQSEHKEITEINKIYNEGQRLLKLGRLDQALAEYQKCIDQANKNHSPALGETASRAYYSIGYIYNRNKKFTESILAYDYASQKNPNNANAYLGKGNVLKTTGRNNEAVEEYKKAVGVDPLLYSAYYNMGASYLALKQSTNALEAYRNASNASESSGRPNEKAFAYWGRVLYEQSKYTDSIKPLMRSIEIKPNWEAYYYLAESLYNLRQYAQAIVNAEQCLKYKRGFGGANMVAGKAYLKLEDKASAIRSFEAAQKDRTWRDQGRYQLELLEKGLSE